MENQKPNMMSFTTALERIKGGGSARRAGWLERVGGEFPKVFLKFGIMHKFDGCQTPQSIKPALFNQGTQGMRVILPCLCLLMDGLEIDGWTPSTVDMLAEDWVLEK